MKALKVIGWVLIGVAGVGVLGLALGYGVMALWNWLVPPLFGLPAISFWQAVGLFVLTHLLFNNFGAGAKGAPHKGHKRNGRKFAESVCALAAEEEAAASAERAAGA